MNCADMKGRAKMNQIKLVCFDLDDTLTRDIHSVMFLCILNGNLEPLLEIEKQEAEGKIHWIQADYYKAKLIQGLSEAKIHKGIDDVLKPLKNIATTIETLHKNGIQSIVVTAGPKQVARAVQEKWGFDGYYGSDYEVVDGVFTGEILKHIGDIGKIACLKDYCEKHKISHKECIAVGDGLTDIPLFEYCAESIAINYAPSVVGKATHYLKADDLHDVLQYIFV